METAPQRLASPRTVPRSPTSDTRWSTPLSFNGTPATRSCRAKAAGDTMTSVRTAGTLSDAASAVRTDTGPLNCRS